MPHISPLASPSGPKKAPVDECKSLKIKHKNTQLHGMVVVCISTMNVGKEMNMTQSTRAYVFYLGGMMTIAGHMGIIWMLINF